MQPNNLRMQYLIEQQPAPYVLDLPDSPYVYIDSLLELKDDDGNPTGRFAAYNHGVLVVQFPTTQAYRVFNAALWVPWYDEGANDIHPHNDALREKTTDDIINWDTITPTDFQE